jgi:hypothetical protein
MMRFNAFSASYGDSPRRFAAGQGTSQQVVIPAKAGIQLDLSQSKMDDQLRC